MKKKKYFIAELLCGAALVSAVTGTVLVGLNLRKADASTEAVAAGVLSRYLLGDTFEVPADAKIEADGREYDATRAYLVFPDGRALRDSSFELSMCGEYTLVFEGVTSEGKTVSAAKTFQVLDRLYTYGNSDTQIAFGRFSDFENPKNNAWSSAYSEGLRISLAENDTVTFNRPVNVYESDRINVISMNVLQDNSDADVGLVTVRLTDVYDPSLYMEISYKNDPEAVGNYARASISGGASIGLNNKNNGNSVTVEGWEDYDLRKDPNGTSFHVNWNYDWPETHYQNFTFWLDTASHNKVRVHVRQGSSVNGLYVDPLDMIIAEFDNPDLFPYGFSGFTTGEVWISVTASSYGNGTQLAPIEIAEIGGLSGREALYPDVFVSGYDDPMYEDTTGPAISVEVPETGVNIYAGTPVSIPEATVRDPSGVYGGRAEAVVWYSVNASNRQMVSVKNGEFVPERTGEYTIVYTAKDYYGVQSTKSIVLQAVEKAKEGQLGIGLTYPEKDAWGAGDILSFEDSVVTTLNGEAAVSVKITDPDGICVTVGLGSEFILGKTGRYTVEYICTDIIYRCVYTQEIDVTDLGQYGFATNSILMPVYAIKGAHYSVTEVNLYHYTGGNAVLSDYRAYMISDGAEQLCDREDVEITANNTVQFKYVAVNDPTKVVYSNVMRVVDVDYNGSLQLENYFVGGYTGSRSLLQNFTHYSRSEGEAKLEFINPLLTSTFSVRFSVPEGEKDCSVTFVLTDYRDRAQSLRFTVGEDGTGSYVKINGGSRRTLDAALIGSTPTVTYSAADQAFTVAIGSKTLKINSDVSLPSSMCLFTMEFDNVDRFNVYSLSGQSFSGMTTKDNGNPTVVIGEMDGIAKIGTEFVIPVPAFADVLAPTVNSRCTLTVLFNGKVYVGEDGTTYRNVPADREYVIRLTEYGNYNFTYEFNDGNGNSTGPAHLLKVLDDEPPVIALNKEQTKPQEVRAGERVAPLSYTVSDNLSAEENITVTVIVYDSKGMLVTASRIGSGANGEFTLQKAGLYTVYLYCMDEIGNVSYVTYQVNAK